MVDLAKFLAKPFKTIREHTDELLESVEVLNEFSYIDKKNYELLKIACEYHDYGKINDEFQKRVKSTKKLIFDTEKEVAHNVLSLCFLNKKEFENPEDFYMIAYAILNHHHHTNNFNEIAEKEDLIKQFIDKFDGRKIKSRLVDSLFEMKNNKNAQLLKGLLHKCDYAASGEYTIEYKNDFLESGLENLLKEWKKKDENAEWNELQNYCEKNKNENIMVVANTGMGKTEAGLLWIGNKKGFFYFTIEDSYKCNF